MIAGGEIMRWLIIQWLSLSTLIYIPLALWSNFEASGHCLIFSANSNKPEQQRRRFVKNRRFSYLIFPSISLVLGLPLSFLNIRAEWILGCFFSAICYLLLISWLFSGHEQPVSEKAKREESALLKWKVYPALIALSLLTGGLIAILAFLVRKNFP